MTNPLAELYVMLETQNELMDKLADLSAELLAINETATMQIENIMRKEQTNE